MCVIETFLLLPSHTRNYTNFPPTYTSTSLIFALLPLRTKRVPHTPRLPYSPHTPALSRAAPSCTPASSRTYGPHSRFHTRQEFLASSGLRGERKRVWAKSAAAPGRAGLGREEGIGVSSFSE